jgi:tRNA dimethylallyltransferase
MNLPYAIVICGATATGKSGLAIEMAQRLNTEIISADSRQIYREFDIGTAKVSIAQQQLVTHHLVDRYDPTYNLTLAEYQAAATTIIDRLRSQQKIPILVGGTGLYLKSIVKGMQIPRVPPQLELRAQLTALGQSQCYQMLTQIDPIAVTKIHPHDPTRTIRALEVYYTTGQTISSQQGESPPAAPIIQIGLDCQSLDLLTTRIERRTLEMVEIGWEQEVKDLVAKYGDDLPLLNTLGYAEMRAYLRQEINRQQAIDLTILHTRQFAKRQRTWFRAINEITWYDSNDSQLVDRVWPQIDQIARFIELDCHGHVWKDKV